MNLGRRGVGLAAAAFGIVALVAHAAPPPLLVAAAAQIAGGTAMQFRRTATAGAAIVAVVYLVFVARTLPAIAAAPQVYNNWGNFFEQLALLTGAALVLTSSSRLSTESLARIGCIVVGACAVSFALEQAVYLPDTAGLVPAWIPPGRVFWADATTVAFALAAVALLANRAALLASRLLAVMVAGFGVVVWLPLLFANPHSRGNWSETVETFAIAATVLVLGELLGGV